MRPILISCHTRPVIAVKFNKDGDLFFTGSFDGKVSVFWSEPVERLGTFACDGAVKTMTVTEDSKYIVIGTAINGIFVFEVETGLKVKTIEFSTKIHVRDVEFAMGSQQFFMISYESDEKKQSVVYIYDFESVLNREQPSRRDLVRRDRDHYYRGVWGYLNKTIVLGTQNGIIDVVDTKTGELLLSHRAHVNQITSLAFSPDFSMLITASRDCFAKLLDPETLKEIRVFNAQRPLNSAVISPLMLNEGSPKYHCLVAGGQEARDVTTTATDQGGFEITFYNMIFEREIGSVRGHFGPVHSVAVHPRGHMFVTGSEDGTARVHILDQDYFTPAYD
mmetsp:Transcript_20429/g.20400  ORF Transcript_20429/g.20400 Transcript_20429/m.20400 type:complete len:334 (-) Transcript_20429:47-1048(-)